MVGTLFVPEPDLVHMEYVQVGQEKDPELWLQTPNGVFGVQESPLDCVMLVDGVVPPLSHPLIHGLVMVRLIAVKLVWLV